MTIGRDTLIDEKSLPHLTKLLSPPGTYGLSSLWKYPRLDGHFSIDTSKKEWIRLVIE